VEGHAPLLAEAGSELNTSVGGTSHQTQPETYSVLQNKTAEIEMVEAVEHVQVTQIVHRTQQNKLHKLQMCASQFSILACIWGVFHPLTTLN